MNGFDLLQYTQSVLIIVLYLSMPPIIVATVVGVLVGLLQALTQIQDQTLPFAVKLLAVIVAIIITAPWLTGGLIEYTDRVFTDFPIVTR